MLYQSSSGGSPILPLLLILAIVGAIADWKYHKTGGKPSSRSDRILFWVVALFAAGAIALAEYTGGPLRHTWVHGCSARCLALLGVGNRPLENASQVSPDEAGKHCATIHRN